MENTELKNKQNLDHMAAHIDLFKCPRCGGAIVIGTGVITCLGCNARYGVDNGISLMYAPNNWDGKEDVTDEIKAFYENTPFPNYESMETSADLIEKAEQGYFANLLNQQIPFSAKVLEVGCGTGQMTNYLAIANRYTFGVDICLNSLKLATEFKNRNDLNRVGFYQMNLFRPIFKEESFHLVICNGVLHHTSDPAGGFKSIAKLVKKNGYIFIGLYNKYGRLITDIRRVLFNASHDKFKFLDPRLRHKAVGDIRKTSWFNDQYKNPHESKHTIGEALHWFDEAGFEFYYGVPSPKAFQKFKADDRIFKQHERGSTLDHFIVQLNLVFTGSREGGFFILIGKRTGIA